MEYQRYCDQIVHLALSPSLAEYEANPIGWLLFSGSWDTADLSHMPLRSTRRIVSFDSGVRISHYTDDLIVIKKAQQPFTLYPQ